VRHACGDYASVVIRASGLRGLLGSGYASRHYTSPALELLAALRASTEPTLLFIDDLGQAPLDVQAALMRLFDADELPSNVLIWGATNRPGDKAGVTALCEPLRSRFALAFSIATPGSEDTPEGSVMLQPWKSELEAWCDWAWSNGAAPEIVAWHRATNGRTLYAWKPSADPALRMADFRSWATCIRLWAAGLTDLSTIAAAIGKPAAAEFLAFASLASTLPTPDQIRIDPMGASVPSDASALYLICANLSACAEPRDARPFVAYLTRLPRVFGALLGRDLYRRLGAKLSGAESGAIGLPQTRRFSCDSLMVGKDGKKWTKSKLRRLPAASSSARYQRVLGAPSNSIVMKLCKRMYATIRATLRRYS